MLAAARPGDLLPVLGPIGNGFVIPESAGHIALIAGGVGMPPLFFLAETLRRTPCRDGDDALLRRAY